MDIEKKYIALVSKDNLDRNKPFILCSYCDKIMIKPIQCKDCNQCYCSKCLTNLPNHKVSLFFSSIFSSKDTKCSHQNIEPCVKAHNIIQSLCFNCKYSCKEIIKLADYKEHIELKCSKLEYKAKTLDMLNKKDQLIEKNNQLEIQVESMRRQYFQTIKMNASWITNSNEIQYEGHTHSLKYITRNIYWICDKCKKPYDDKSFYCSLCDYNLCIECVIEKLLFS